MRKLVKLLISVLLAVALALSPFASAYASPLLTTDDPLPQIKGTIVIDGNAVVGDFVSVDISQIYEAMGLTDIGVVEYKWILGGQLVSNEAVYEFTPADVGKTVTIEISSDGTTGSVQASTPNPVGKASTPKPDAPTAATIAPRKITLTIPDGEYSWEYSKDSGGNWQTSNVFDGLEPDTDYSFIVRAGETAWQTVSESSASAAVRTKVAYDVTVAYENTDGKGIATPVVSEVEGGKSFNPAVLSIEKYQFDDWKLDGISQGYSNPTLPAVSRNHSIVLVYAPLAGPGDVKVSSINITNAPARFSYHANGIGNTLPLNAAVAPANASKKALTWTSNAPAIASVNATSGLLTFYNVEGKVTITAKATDGSNVSISKDIEVVKNVTKVRVVATKLNLKVKKKIKITPVLDDGKLVVSGQVDYATSKATVATVDKNGNVKAGKKPGKATITVTAKNGAKASVKVTVVKKAVKLKKFTLKGVKKKTVTLKAGATKDLKIKLAQAKASDLKWAFKSNKAKIVSVDAAGRLKAIAKGKAKIKVTVGGKKVTVTVKVK